MLHRLFRPKPTQAVGRALYAAVVEQSRSPTLYAELGAPDTVEGRFEVYSLHVMLLLERLGVPTADQDAEQAKDTAQALFDTYVKALDDALREMGVGDLSVGKKMRKLGEAFFGRAKSFRAAFAALPDEPRLRDLVSRTVYAEADPGRAPDLAGYVLAQRAALHAQPLAAILDGRVAWGPA